MKDNFKRHRALIAFLQQFDLYKKSIVIEDERCLKDLINLNTNDINKTVFLIGDFLNYHSGSSETLQLYKLLQAYFLNIEKRHKINEIIED